MGISYTDELSDLRPSQLSGFFAGWPKHPDPAAHLEILRGSHAVWLAMDGDRCVGFVNALSDGGFYAHIPLLEVLPEYKGRGIGSELLRRMTQTLEGHYAVDVLCDEDVAAFYESRGFRRCVGMALRNYEHQERVLPGSPA
ncbi:MAG: GNAT family N-acetyltransferase [Chthonomonadaceae bacterium]|nr:GNAT family N-acetyltransferase [Chthonomonadaceae bacterium]